MKYLGDPQSGSRAAITASRNRYGQYYRARAIPVQPRTAKQLQFRTRLSEGSQNWSIALDASDRQAWRDYAAAHPRVNSLGVSNVLSGQAMYISAYVSCISAGLTPPTAPGLLGSAVVDPTMVVTAAAGTPALSFAFSPPDAGYAYVVFVSPQVSPGVTFPPVLRRLTTMGSASTSPFNALASYLSLMGGSLQEGMKIIVSSQAVDPNGLVTSVRRSDAIIAA